MSGKTKNRRKKVEIPDDPDVQWEGAKLAIANAMDLLEVSRAASSLGKYGIASALAVLSAEEAAKAMGLMAHAMQENPGLKPLDGYFTSHKQKHGAGAAFVLAKRFIQNVLDKAELVNSDSTISESDKKQVFIDLLMKEASVGESGPPPFLEGIHEWHQGADEDKQAGFYVGYFNNEWAGPRSVSMQKAGTCQKMAEEQLDLPKRIIEFGDRATLKRIIEDHYPRNNF